MIKLRRKNTGSNGDKPKTKEENNLTQAEAKNTLTEALKDASSNSQQFKQTVENTLRNYQGDISGFFSNKELSKHFYPYFDDLIAGYRMLMQIAASKKGRDFWQ